MPSLSIALLRGIYLLITCSLSCFSASSKETHVEALFSMWKLVRWKSLESSVALCVCAQLFSHVQLFAIPWTVSPPGSSVHFPSKSTDSGCHFLLQGIFLTQGGQIRISHIGRWILYHWDTWETLRGFRTQLLGLAGPLFLLFSRFVCMASDQGSVLWSTSWSCPPECSFDRAPRIEIYADSVKGLWSPFSETFP